MQSHFPRNFILSGICFSIEFVRSHDPARAVFFVAIQSGLFVYFGAGGQLFRKLGHRVLSVQVCAKKRNATVGATASRPTVKHPPKQRMKNEKRSTLLLIIHFRLLSIYLSLSL